MKNCQEIVEGVYLGGVDAVKERTALQKTGITHILQMVGRQHHAGHLSYHRCFLPDREGAGPQLLAALPEACQFIREALAGGGKVLLHCRAGMSRSPCLLMGYLIAERGMSLREAFLLIASHRPAIKPNLTFLPALLEWERSHSSLSSCEPSRWPKIPR